MTTLIATNASFTHITVQAKSLFTGNVDAMELPLSLGEFQQGIEKWDAGDYIQNAFPTLNATQREFLMTGLSDSEQERVFPHPEADEDTPI
jgi:hypothetical protein